MTWMLVLFVPGFVIYYLRYQSIALDLISNHARELERLIIQLFPNKWYKECGRSLRFNGMKSSFYLLTREHHYEQSCLKNGLCRSSSSTLEIGPCPGQIIVEGGNDKILFLIYLSAD